MVSYASTGVISRGTPYQSCGFRLRGVEIVVTPGVATGLALSSPVALGVGRTVLHVAPAEAPLDAEIAASDLVVEG
jgi:hypothetical protein